MLGPSSDGACRLAASRAQTTLSTMPCIFCGSRNCREHVYSGVWMRRRITHPESHTNRLCRDFEGDPVATWTSSEADVVVRCVCRDCNSGWMNDLDRAAEPIVNALARGADRVRVTEEALEVFASCVVKLALVMECGSRSPPDRTQPAREYLYRVRRPPRGYPSGWRTMEGYEEETRTTPIALVSAPELGGGAGLRRDIPEPHPVVQVVVPSIPTCSRSTTPTQRGSFNWRGR
jgi:hypothetical protein